MPLREEAPMYRKTPYSTGMGMNWRHTDTCLFNEQRKSINITAWVCVFAVPPLTFSTEVMKTEQPIRVKIMRPVKRCSRMPRNLGCSPGAEHSDSSFRLFTWEMESTVAATNHGRPITEHTPSITPTTNRSRW